MKSALLLLVSASLVWGQVPRYDVTMTAGDYSLLYTRDIFSDSLLPGPLTFQATTWSDARIRFKGNSTRYYPKKSFRLRFTNANLFFGAAQINLNSMYTDKSLLREKLAWDLFADMGTLAPQARYGNYFINGSWKGLYLVIDRVDRNFLTLRGRISAPMYEADDVYSGGDLTMQPDSVLKLYYGKTVGSATDYADLTQLISALNLAPDARFADTVDAYFDVNSVLQWFCGNILTMMGDSYNKNYYLYRDTSRPAQQWVVIPWDYDLSFGRSGDLSMPYPASLLNDKWAFTYPPLSGPPNVLKDRFWSTPSLRERLRQRLDTLLKTIFTEAHLLPRIDSLAALIHDDAAADPEKWGTAADVEEHAEALKYYVTARRSYLNKTFIHPPDGLYNDVTLAVSQTDVPYHFVAYDGRLLATLWFTDIAGLDSIRVQAYPGLVPSHVQNPGDGRYVKRWIRITPYPGTAQFTARLRWMYEDAASSSEVGSGVQNERLLRPYVYDGTAYQQLAGHVNGAGNFVIIDSITEAQCTPVSYFALLMPDSYTQKWFRQPLFNWQRWYDIGVAGPQTALAVGDHGTVLRTRDAGASWTESAIGFNRPFTRVAIASADKIFASGDFGTLARSADSGATWSFVDLGTIRAFNGVRFLGGSAGWVFGDQGALYTTKNGGATWQEEGLDTALSVADVAAVNDNAYCVLLRDGSTLRTTNGGATWSSGNVGSPGLVRRAAALGSLAWVVGDSGFVASSSDEGTTWSPIPIPAAITLRGIEVLSPTTLYVAGDGGAVYYTTDNGAAWYRQYTADAHDLYAVAFTDSAHGYAVGNAGTILMTASPGTVTAVPPARAQLPEGFALEENYPNPFNPSTVIGVRIAEAAVATLTVYDLLGRQAAVLMHRPLAAGDYDVPWNAAGMASGVYFYRLELVAPRDGRLLFRQTKKMLLLR